jgi:site-specific recombinase XerD
LRVKDVDFTTNQILVRDGKGFKDRVTMLPEAVRNELQQHIERLKTFHRNELEAGRSLATLPYALARKYPNLSKSLQWQYVFPAARMTWMKRRSCGDVTTFFMTRFNVRSARLGE